MKDNRSKAGNLCYQPRWATKPLYFKCTYEDYVKLRRIKKWFWICVKRFADNYRWNRKQSQNRSGKEPSVPNHPFIITYNKGDCRVEADDMDFIELYEQARQPNYAFVPPFNSVITNRINSAYETLRTQFEGEDNETKLY